jgi:hypothetical protein
VATLQSISSLVSLILGDPDRSLWTEPYLTGFINSAYEDLIDQLRNSSVQRMKFRTEFTVAAGTTSLILVGQTPVTGEEALLPADTIEPDALWDNQTGTTGLQNFILMQGPGVLPTIAQTNVLRYWDWRGGAVRLVGSTVARRVMLDYYGQLASLAFLSDKILIQGPATNALAYFVAGAAVRSRGDEVGARSFEAKGQTYVDRLINEEIKQQQSNPVRRRPYRGVGRYLRPVY